ncbi:hypothetical protein [Fluviispira multicolorata]|uniref:Uncharacterized protein n=1 Tax=Fluviispira multicolorata TaxID=2654512 RepID=A0A833JFJ9_9BACT|nr:hypothetical protein [Fluviispira multicolorata]KAB8031060.1 hypothetical protein GCL57_08825 [Fluviispira multicolorata]
MNINFKRSFLIILSLVNIYVFFAREAFSEEAQEKKSIVTLDNDEKMMSNIKSRISACVELDNKILSYVDKIYFLKDCKLRLIKGSEIVNKLIQIRKKKIINLTSEVYSLIPIGENYGNDEYYNEFEKRNALSLRELCNLYEKGILTSDNINYFFIENCKRRPFEKYSDVLLFNGKSRPIYSLQPQTIEIFPLGRPVLIEKNNLDIVESEGKLKKHLPSAQKLCGSLNRKVVTFHDSYYFIEDCHLFKIKNLTLEIQKKADNLGGIQELTVVQKLGIPEGEEIRSDEVLKKIR